MYFYNSLLSHLNLTSFARSRLTKPANIAGDAASLAAELEMQKENGRKMAADLKAALREKDSACLKYEFALEKLSEQREETWGLKDELKATDNHRVELLNTVIQLLMDKMGTQDLHDLAHDVDETVALGIFKTMGSADEPEDNTNTLDAREIFIQTIAKQEQRLIMERYSKVETGTNNNEQASIKDGSGANYNGYAGEEPDGNLMLLAKPPNKKKSSNSVVVAKKGAHQTTRHKKKNGRRNKARALKAISRG